MSSDSRAAAIFALAALVVWLLTPLAIRAAMRLRLIDIPTGYKAHTRATPYLGGAAILIGVVVAALVLSGPTPGVSLKHGWSVVACALVLWAVGTLDDRVNLPVTVRVGVEVGLAVALWYFGHGWLFFLNGGLNLVLTVVWVVGIVNAFNLMDNMDGAATTVAGVSALGAGVLALLSGRTDWAPLCFAVAGACLGFLPYNLARPARIFLGDGGSLPLGLMIAALIMSVVRSHYLGAAGVLVGGLLVGMVILDTTLVTYSRARGHRPLFRGGRDHLTHRAVERLGSPAAVAGTLAVTQLAVSAIAIAVARAGSGWVILAGATCFALGVVLIWQLEYGRLVRPPVSRASVGEASDDILSTGTGLPEQSQVQAGPQGERAIA